MKFKSVKLFSFLLMFVHLLYADVYVDGYTNWQGIPYANKENNKDSSNNSVKCINYFDWRYSSTFKIDKAHCDYLDIAQFLIINKALLTYEILLVFD